MVAPSRQSANSAARGLGLARLLDTVLTAVVMCVGRLARDCYEVSVDVPELRRQQRQAGDKLHETRTYTTNKQSVTATTQVDQRTTAASHEGLRKLRHHMPQHARPVRVAAPLATRPLRSRLSRLVIGRTACDKRVTFKTGELHTTGQSDRKPKQSKHCSKARNTNSMQTSFQSCPHRWPCFHS